MIGDTFFYTRTFQQVTTCDFKFYKTYKSLQKRWFRCWYIGLEGPVVPNPKYGDSGSIGCSSKASGQTPDPTCGPACTTIVVLDEKGILFEGFVTFHVLERMFMSLVYVERFFTSTYAISITLYYKHFGQPLTHIYIKINRVKPTDPLSYKSEPHNLHDPSSPLTAGPIGSASETSTFVGYVWI